MKREEDKDRVMPWDLPAIHRPKQQAVVRWAVLLKDQSDEDFEVWTVSRETVTVVDFYRGRPG